MQYGVAPARLSRDVLETGIIGVNEKIKEGSG
jgi:hypothetical protein